MGRHCLICADPEKLRIAAEMVAAGQPDRAVAEALGVGRMSAQRHRVGHILRGQVSDVAAKRQEADQRQAALTAPRPPFDAGAFLSLPRIAEDLDTLDRQLGAVALAAAVDGKSSALVAIAGQQIRLGEVRAKLGQVGGYAHDRTAGGSNGSFSVVIRVAGSRDPMTITATAQSNGEQEVASGDPWTFPAPPEPEQHPLATGGPAATFRGLTASP